MWLFVPPYFPSPPGPPQIYHAKSKMPPDKSQNYWTYLPGQTTHKNPFAKDKWNATPAPFYGQMKEKIEPSILPN